MGCEPRIGRSRPARRIVAAIALAAGAVLAAGASAPSPRPPGAGGRGAKVKAEAVGKLMKERSDPLAAQQGADAPPDAAAEGPAPGASARPKKPHFVEDSSTNFIPGSPDMFQMSPGTGASPAPGASPGPTEKGIEVARDVITELILDASGSMKQKIQQRTKLFQAKRVLRSFMLESQADNMVLGLRVYGLQEKNCKDTKLVLKFGEKGPEAIDSAMEAVDPKGYGKTPLALSLTDAAKDLAKYPDKPRRIIVVTDGVETCGGDPCKIARQLKEQYDIRIFVVGYTLNEDEREKLKCLADFTGGRMWDANDLSSLLNALKDLSNKDKNLFVKSPDPVGLSELWMVGKGGEKKKVGEFVSSIGVRAEPGVEYEVVVKLVPPFRFKHVVLGPNERRTLEVKGDGVINIRFMEGLFTVSLLNDQGKPVLTFPSDTPTKAPCGYYKIKAVSPPFAEAVIDDIRVVPNGHYEEGIKGFGTLELMSDKDRGPGPFGFYVFDDVKKVDIGSYLTGLPLVLPIGRYTLKTIGNAILKNVYPETNSIRQMPMPPPGQTVTFARRKSDKEDKEDKEKEKEGAQGDKKAPVMLDTLTPEQIRKHWEEKEKEGR